MYQMDSVHLQTEKMQPWHPVENYIISSRPLAVFGIMSIKCIRARQETTDDDT